MNVSVKLRNPIDHRGDHAPFETFEGDEVTADTEDGELLIWVRNIDGDPVHWCRFAEGTWLKVELVEGMSTEVAAVRAARPPNLRGSSPAYPLAAALPSGAVAGNTGPGY